MSASMSEPPPRAKRPDYGIDAPGAVRNLAIGGAAALVLFAVAFPLGWRAACEDRQPAPPSAAFSAPAWLVWGSKVGKVRGRDRLLDSLALRGDEEVLDVGCGRGLLLIGAARRLTTGKAVGVDIWQAEDLSGNRPEATRENARLEGVSDRVEVKDGDARRLPFADGTFDVVVTKCGVAQHLQRGREGHGGARDRARAQTGRPAAHRGRPAHGPVHAQVLRQSGLEDVRRSPESVPSLLIAAISLGFAYPATVRARKPAAAA